MLSMFVGVCILAAIFGSLALFAVSEASLWEPKPVKPARYVRAPGVVVRPDPAFVRPIGAPERVAFPRRTSSGRGSL